VPFLLCPADDGPHFMGLQRNRGRETQSHHLHNIWDKGEDGMKQLIEYSKKLVSIKGYLYTTRYAIFKKNQQTYEKICQQNK
jgi:hypothetical protein